MHQTKRQHLVTGYAVSLSFMTVVLSLLQPIAPASAQDQTRSISQDIGGPGTQGRRIDNGVSGHRYPMKPVEKSHRLIRKPQDVPLASVESPLSDSSTVNSVPSFPPEEPPVSRRSIGAAVPLAPISSTPSAAASTGFTATGTTPVGIITLAAADVGNSTSSGSGRAGGRAMRRLSAEMSGVVQLVSPPSAPTPSGGPVTESPVIGMSPTSLSFTAQQGATSPATQILTINNTGHGTLNWTAGNSATWLTLSPASGTGAGVVTANVVAGALAPGSYRETITLSAPGATPVTIPVSFTVTAAPVPSAIGVSPTSLAFTAIQGVATPPRKRSVSATPAPSTGPRARTPAG